jgi:hypothetical protein
MPTVRICVEQRHHLRPEQVLDATLVGLISTTRRVLCCWCVLVVSTRHGKGKQAADRGSCWTAADVAVARPVQNASFEQTSAGLLKRWNSSGQCKPKWIQQWSRVPFRGQHVNMRIVLSARIDAVRWNWGLPNRNCGQKGTTKRLIWQFGLHKKTFIWLSTHPSLPCLVVLFLFENLSLWRFFQPFIFFEIWLASFVFR